MFIPRSNYVAGKSASSFITCMAVSMTRGMAFDDFGNQ